MRHPFFLRLLPVLCFLSCCLLAPNVVAQQPDPPELTVEEAAAREAEVLIEEKEKAENEAEEATPETPVEDKPEEDPFENDTEAVTSLRKTCRAVIDHLGDKLTPYMIFNKKIRNKMVYGMAVC